MSGCIWITSTTTIVYKSFQEVVELHRVFIFINISMRVLACISLVLLGACGTTTTDSVVTAQPYIGLEERKNRTEIKALVGVDPVRVEWCAAFVNSVLELDGIPGSDSVSEYPLTARSFLGWGTSVDKNLVTRGDVVVFPRGNVSWQGHVGFYVETQSHQGRDYWVILGGNQDNTVSYQLFDPRRAIAVRRSVVPDSNNRYANLFD
jgi:uncharacterized protein (TIGR02594 family)